MDGKLRNSRLFPVASLVEQEFEQFSLGYP